MSGHAGSLISFNIIGSSLSSLKNCLPYINTGMEIATNVAFDLIENGGDEVDINSMENVMIEYAAMDRELNQYIQSVEETIHQIKRDQPEKIPDLKALVKEKFSALQDRNTGADLRRNERYLQFKDQLKEMRKQVGPLSDTDGEQPAEELDEDVTVTQTQMNFICPITQMEMKRPMKNKVCSHVYEKEAIIKMIQNRHQKNKKACCPKVGCSHSDMKITDLVPDAFLKRAIENRNKQNGLQST
ncbi:E3 SUMO-protein ligase NSE2 isoform X2 [Rhinatrema bivittatum]|nr:E3 SUMO-protein ligase NSE2 isoform X2 [Rhinatrema bivittatum]XP_029447876.1 E3 SUMO-protein ligase NSE2 isoform X2 [Rhinatrema bivittatum]XP_029447877.1 E3 SUMO-protein ligase NSE2 isoform X2 [Rhinatrema bivittatum]